MRSNTGLQGNNAPRSQECDLIQSGMLKGASEVQVVCDDKSPESCSSSSETTAVNDWTGMWRRVGWMSGLDYIVSVNHCLPNARSPFWPQYTIAPMDVVLIYRSNLEIAQAFSESKSRHDLHS